MIWLATILLGVLSFVNFYLRTKRKVKLAECFPGPKAHPIFGNVFNYTFDDTLEAKRMTTECHQKFGDIYRITLIRDYQFMVSDPVIYEKVLASTTQNLKKHEVYDFLSPWLRNGLILSADQYWHKHRKIITPAFHFKILEQFIEIFDRQCTIMVDKLMPHADGTVVNVFDHIALMALDIITETAMGTQISAQTNAESDYVKAVESITALITKRFTSLWRRFDIFYATFGYKEKREQQRYIRIMHDFADEIIEKRRAYLINQQQKSTNGINGNGISAHADDKNVDDNSDLNGSKKMVFLDVLLQATVDGRPLSNEEIIEEANTFMFAGHDTTTFATASILHALSRHKHIQDKVLQEIISVFGADAKAPITYRQLNELKYMDLVIKETLRFYPIVPAIGRHVDHDIELDDGRIIPAGVNMNFNFNITLHDPRYFKDPHVFDPDRFASTTSSDNRNPFIYIPFSAGLRNCIGQKYAQLDLKTVVSRMLLNFELIGVGEEPIITYEIVSRSLNGIQLGLKPRIL